MIYLRDSGPITKTKAKVENILYGFNAISKWIYDCLDTGYESAVPLGNTNIFAGQSEGKDTSLKTDDVFDMFDIYNTRYRMGAKYISPTSIGMWLSKIIGVNKKKKQGKGMRRYYYFIPSLDQCRNNFNDYIGYDLFAKEGE